MGRGLSLLHLLNRWETLMSSFLILTLSFLAVATTFIGVLMLRPGQALDLKTFPSVILFETVDGLLVL